MKKFVLCYLMIVILCFISSTVSIAPYRHSFVGKQLVEGMEWLDPNWGNIQPLKSAIEVYIVNEDDKKDVENWVRGTRSNNGNTYFVLPGEQVTVAVHNGVIGNETVTKAPDSYSATQSSQSNSADSDEEFSLKDKFPIIEKVMNENGFGTLEVMHITTFDNLYFVNTEGSQKSKYTLVEYDGTTATIIFAFDPMLNDAFCPSRDCGDYNQDGNFECLFVKEMDEYVMFYVYSIRSDKAVLISPVDNQFRSLIWQDIYNDEPLYIYDEDGDGFDEIIADGVGPDGNLIRQIWYWDPATQQYRTR